VTWCCHKPGFLICRTDAERHGALATGDWVEHRHDVSFDQELSSTLGLSVTNPAHLSVQDYPSSSPVYEVKSSVKPNGNQHSISTPGDYRCSGNASK